MTKELPMSQHDEGCPHHGTEHECNGELFLHMTPVTKKRYRELLEKEIKLDMLEAAGVDNWDWYDDALNPDGEDSYRTLVAALPTIEEMDDA